MRTAGYILPLILSLFGLQSSICSAQVAPTSDPHWVLNTSRSDEFTGNSVDQTKWQILHLTNGSNGVYNWGGNSYFLPSQTTQSGGALILEAEAPNPGAIPPYSIYECCYTGGVKSTTQYGYGYFEILAKLPGFYDSNGLSVGLKYWPSFWLAHQEVVTIPGPPPFSCVTIHDEIDILEPSGNQYADGRTNVFGWHDEFNCGTYKVDEGSYSHWSPLFVGYHKYAAEWLPDRLTFLFDDVPVYSITNNSKLVMHQQDVVIDLQLDGSVFNFHPETPFPQYMNVAHFRYYELTFDCGNTLIINDQFAYDTAPYEVKESIEIGDGSNPIEQSQVERVFRAQESIRINSHFVAPLGKKLKLIPTSCSH